jgi:hypothetical protein
MLEAGAVSNFETLDTAVWMRCDHIIQQVLIPQVNASYDLLGPDIYPASVYGYLGILRKLLYKGVGINALLPYRMARYRTALESASQSRHEELVKQLLEAGADVNAPCGVFPSSDLH